MAPGWQHLNRARAPPIRQCIAWTLSSSAPAACRRSPRAPTTHVVAAGPPQPRPGRQGGRQAAPTIHTGHRAATLLR